jgi:hypothetical protein
MNKFFKNPFAISWKKKLAKMSNVTTFSGLNPMTLRMAGSGEYVKRECEHLVDLFDLAKFDLEEEIRQDYEHE